MALHEDQVAAVIRRWRVEKMIEADII